MDSEFSSALERGVDGVIGKIRRLEAENASLKTIVEKFTAERSKGQGTANKQSKYAAQIAARLSERIVYNEFLSQSLRDYVAWEVRQLLTL